MIKDVPNAYLPYVGIPVGEAFLNPTNYPYIMSAFVWGDQKLLKPEYVPSRAFTATNIQLYAAIPSRKQDVAYLSYRKSGEDFLIVQTGGWQGKIYFLTKGVTEAAWQARQRCKSSPVGCHCKVHNYPHQCRNA